MKRTTLITLLVLVLALGGASLLVRQQYFGGWQQQGTLAESKILGDFPLNDVAQILITTGDGSLHLIRKEERWLVKEKDYPADFQQVSRLLRVLWELKAVQDVTAGPSQLPRLQLVEPSGDAKDAGILVDLSDAQNKRLAALLVGKNFLRSEPGMPGEGFPAGRYVMALDGQSHVALVGETLNEISTKPDTWLDRAFLRIDRIKSVSLDGTPPGMKWRIQRESEDSAWQLADTKPDERVDPSKLPTFASALGSPNFTDVLPRDTKPESIGLDKPVTLLVDTFDGFNYTIKAGTLADDKYPIIVAATATIEQTRKPGADEKPEDKKRLDEEFAAKKMQLDERLAKTKDLENRIFLVPRFVIETLLKERSSFFATPNPAPSPSPSPGAGVSVTTPPVAVPPPGATAGTPRATDPKRRR